MSAALMQAPKASREFFHRLKFSKVHSLLNLPRKMTKCLLLRCFARALRNTVGMNRRNDEKHYENWCVFMCVYV